MRAIDADDMLTIHSLRRHRNDLAHDLQGRLPTLQVESKRSMFGRVDAMPRKLSACCAYMDIGADPEFRGIDWDSVLADGSGRA